MIPAEVEQRALEIVDEWETARIGRPPADVSNTGCGYDRQTFDRLIEVKDVGESWRTWTFQSLTAKERDVLVRDPDHFWLYIVKFDRNTGEHLLYTLSGRQILDHPSFNLVPVQSYQINGMNRARLEEFRQSCEPKKI